MSFQTDGPALAQRGFRVVPLQPRTKRPRFARWLDLATDDPETVARWARDYAHCGTGLVPHQQVVVDADDPEGLSEYLAARNVTLPATFEVATARGTHRWYTLPGELDVPNAQIPGADIKVRGMLVGPGSIHPSGVRYRLLDDRAPSPAPIWLIELLAENATRRRVQPTGAEGTGAGGARRSDPRRVVGRVHAARVGERNNITFWGFCRAAEDRDESYMDLIRAAAEEIGLDANEIATAEHSARRRTGWMK